MSMIEEGLVATGRGKLVPALEFAHLAIGTFVSRDIEKARHRLEHFFGMECVEVEPGHLLARDRRAKFLMDEQRRDFFLLEITQVADVERPQALANHWGFSIGSEEEVDRIRKAAVERSAEFGIKTVHPVTKMHGSYGFFLIDDDDNWWEIEYRRGITNDFMFSRGDWNSEGRGTFPVIDPPLDIASTPSDILGDEAFMTHGTTAVGHCEESRAFYEEILGLRSVWQGRPANCFAGGGDFAVVGIGSAEKTQDQSPANRFVILVDDDAQVRARHAQVEAVASHYGLMRVLAVADDAAEGTSFKLKTADGIWFEISSRSRNGLIEAFANRRRL